MTKAGRQSIRCQVMSCKYNDKGECDLDMIQVSPGNAEIQGLPGAETMCASYYEIGGK
ncbi:MAG: DUF1540 domain-containing protein [Syntrophomonadaceae bacterium]|nr:DUF1540 domain-containing protein [Syntrophomonadaceae bacterium]